MKRKPAYFVALVLVIAAATLANTQGARMLWSDLSKPKLPPAESISVANEAVAPNNTTTEVAIASTSVTAVIPDAKNLAVPFTSQAPQTKWDQDHEEFCEEAAVIMVGRFFRGRNFTGSTDAEAALQRAKAWELKNLGFYYDTTAAETAKVVTGLYGLKVTLKVNPTVTDIKRALANNQLVIVPTAGRQLGNPNFTAPGPIYHNLVIRGYTKDGKFITNDPGTRKGEGYVYKTSVVMNAIRDWVPSGNRTKPRQGDVANGRKVVLLVSAK